VEGTRTEVHRVYLTLDATGTLVPGAPSPDLERWCPACLLTYPHVLAEPGPGAG
jgi:hypothetical protein